MLNKEPAYVHAIIVGVDHYGYGDKWDLNGPAQDALNTIDWLLLQGVPPQNIALFLSDRSWNCPSVLEWSKSKAGLVQKAATDRVLAEYVNIELPKLKREALFVFWGGHAVAGDHEEKLFLYTANAAEGIPFCLRAEDLAAALSDVRFSHLDQQVLIFDVCANQASVVRDPVPPTPAALVIHKRDAKIAQCRMYAASQGKRAANIPERNTGLFSSLLLAELKNCKSPSIQQFVDAFLTLEKGAAANGLNAQRPFLHRPGEHLLPGITTHLGREENELLEMVGKANLSHAHVKRIYLQSQPRIELRALPEDIEHWLVDLKDLRPRTTGYPSPIVEFAERLGRELSLPELQRWAKENSKIGQYQTLCRKLDRDDRTESKRIANLFIEISSARAQSFTWWIEGSGLYVSNKQVVAIEGDGLRSTLIRAVPKILSHAEGLIRGRFEIRIGFILPTELLAKGLEVINIRVSSEDDELEIGALNEQYTVLFHWILRVSHRATREFNNWGELVKDIEPQLGLDEGTGVVWLEQGAHNDMSRFVRASETLRTGPEGAICLGIEHLPREDESMQLEHIKQCLKQGVPCLFWFEQPTDPGHSNDRRSRINDAFARQRPSNAPITLWREQRALTTATKIGVNSIVWDLPAYLPSYTPDQSLFEDHQ